MLLELPDREVMGYSTMAELQGPTNKQKDYVESCIDMVWSFNKKCEICLTLDTMTCLPW